MIKLTTDARKLLNHYATFATSIHLMDGQPIMAKHPDNAILGFADIQDCDFSDAGSNGIAIFDLKTFNNALKFFDDDVEITIEEKDDDQYIKFTNGKFAQEYFLSDPSMIESLIPKAENVEALCNSDFDVTFDMDEKTMNVFKKGVAMNGGNCIVIKSVDGKVIIAATDVDETGNHERSSHSFTYDTGIETSHDFNIGFISDNFNIIPGGYTISFNENMILFSGDVVSFIMPLTRWSEIN